MELKFILKDSNEVLNQDFAPYVKGVYRKTVKSYYTIEHHNLINLKTPATVTIFNTTKLTEMEAEQKDAWKQSKKRLNDFLLTNKVEQISLD